MEKHTVQNSAGHRLKTKRNIAHTQGGEYTWKFLFNTTNGVDGFNTRFPKFFVPATESKCECIENNIAGWNSIFLRAKVINPLGDFELAIRPIASATTSRLLVFML
jgi:hypothetical protein